MHECLEIGDIDISVSVNIGGKHITGSVRRRRNTVRGERLRAVVFVPDHLICVGGSREQVSIAVSVNVSYKYAS